MKDIILKFIIKNIGDILGILGLSFISTSVFLIFGKNIGIGFIGLMLLLLCYLINSNQKK